MASPFATHLKAGITLSVEVAFTVNEFIIGTGILGTTPLGPVPVWTDITAYIESYTTKRGRSRALDRTPTGTLSIGLINTSGRFDPTNLSGPYVSGGKTLVTPGCPIRMRAEYGGVQYPVWQGNVDAWPGSWAKGKNTTAPAFSGIEATGVFGWNAGTDIAAGFAQGFDEPSGARIHRVLNAVNWPTFARDVDTGRSDLHPTAKGGTVVDLLQSVADSEGGIVFEGADGSIVFRDRHAPYKHVESRTPRAVFGDSGSELRYYDATFDYSKDTVRNDITLGREGSDTRVTMRGSPDSRRRNGVQSYENTNLQNATDAGLVPLGRQILNQFGEAELRFDTLTIRPQRDPTHLWPIVLGLDLRHRITIKRRPASGNVIVQDCFIESIAHNAPQNGPYEIKFELSSAAAYVTNPFIIGTSLLGGTDVLVP